MIQQVPFLVIGSGVAGLFTALKIAQHHKVTLITKSSIERSNTNYAQGGIAAVTYLPDTFEKHVEDTMICGAGLCNEESVRYVVENAPKGIRDLENYGVRFDKKGDQTYDLAKEGGHSEYRILHHNDLTGGEIARGLIEAVRKHSNITVLEHHFAIDLITQHHLGKMVRRYHSDITCYGAYVLDINTSSIITFLAQKTILATGGAGHVYHATTNPLVATGDGVAMVYRAKGVVEDMAYIQFHPTSLYNPGERPSFLITEAMRGFGGILRTLDGKEFMHKYDPRKSLAPRDIVARAIDNEMKVHGVDHIYLDVTHKNKEDIIAHFPNIYEKCLRLGIDITRDYIPVVPVAHFMCGGVKVDKYGQSSIHNLYAVGEVSCTGLHGANRLASNSLIEAVVYATATAKHAIDTFDRVGSLPTNIPEWNDDGTSQAEEMVLITQSYKEVQQLMSYYVGIVRSNLRLERAFHRLHILYQETEQLYRRSTVTLPLCELRNIIQVGYLIIKEAKALRESRGLHYSIDCPKR